MSELEWANADIREPIAGARTASDSGAPYPLFTPDGE